MQDPIELTLQSIHGVVWKPVNNAGQQETNSKVKACVSFSGSAPDMQVSSFTMCPRTGNLVVESNELKATSTKETDSMTMDASFDDPLESERSRRRLSSSHSSSSGTSNSSCRPHLQFLLHGEEEQPHEDKYQGPTKHGKCIEMHITLRSDDPEVSIICQEGIAYLTVPEKFEKMPTSMDLPIAVTEQEKPSDASETPQNPRLIGFDESAFVRIQLSLASDRQRRQSQDQSSNETNLVLSDNLDEIQLGGIVKMMHEREEIDEARFKASKLLKQDNNGDASKRRNWILFCNGSNDFKHSFQTFFEIMRGCEGSRKVWKTTRCSDPEQDLFLNATMASTIVTRESLEI